MFSYLIQVFIAVKINQPPLHFHQVYKFFKLLHIILKCREYIDMIPGNTCKYGNMRFVEVKLRTTVDG